MIGIRPHRRCNGWTLMELITIMAILGVVMLAASKLLMASLAIHHKSHDQLTQMNGRRHAIDTLRRDVWNAAQMTLDQDKSLVIHQAAGRVILWR